MPGAPSVYFIVLLSVLSSIGHRGSKVVVSLYEGTPVGAELPKTVVLAVTEADAVVRGQTASSSYKPAIVEGGVRVMVPPHIGVGTRLVINTEDGSYMERAKD